MLWWEAGLLRGISKQGDSGSALDKSVLQIARTHSFVTTSPSPAAEVTVHLAACPWIT